LVARDRQRAGKIEELAVGVIASNYENYLYYEPLEEFLAGDGTSEIEQGPPPDEPPPQITLKTTVVPFVPPEKPAADEEEDSAKG
jgi:hypothetical protein